MEWLCTIVEVYSNVFRGQGEGENKLIIPQKKHWKTFYVLGYLARKYFLEAAHVFYVSLFVMSSSIPHSATLSSSGTIFSIRTKLS